MDIGESFENTTDTIFAFLPRLLGFLLVLLIGYIIAKVVAGIVRKLLDRMHVDQKLRQSSSAKQIDAVLPGTSVSAGIASIVFWLIFLIFLFTAVGVLKIAVLTTFMNDVLAYLPNVLVAIAIFIIAALVSGVVATAVTKFMGDTPTGKIVASVVPALIMVIAMFMILEQLQIAPEIVRIAFAAVMFALALGLALAFGLGGKDVASRLLEDAYRKGGDAKEQAKQDLQQGRDRAKESYEQSDLSGSSTTGTTTTGSTGATAGSGTYTSPSTSTTSPDQGLQTQAFPAPEDPGTFRP
ncbi:mechanosensitive ion channel family protein [Nocardioides piscis]|uniref:Transporter n=1 Tax=Nocardioides piscis TaxID=2714938 RepID=A0A6G7YFA8_9ACTN|nr:transporter [Nocardioides piscis]QIK75297.1 transporter [Nocardioides piscis]